MFRCRDDAGRVNSEQALACQIQAFSERCATVRLQRVHGKEAVLDGHVAGLIHLVPPHSEAGNHLNPLRKQSRLTLRSWATVERDGSETISKSKRKVSHGTRFHVHIHVPFHELLVGEARFDGNVCRLFSLRGAIVERAIAIETPVAWVQGVEDAFLQEFWRIDSEMKPSKVHHSLGFHVGGGGVERFHLEICLSRVAKAHLNFRFREIVSHAPFQSQHAGNIAGDDALSFGVHPMALINLAFVGPRLKFVAFHVGEHQLHHLIRFLFRFVLGRDGEGSKRREKHPEKQSDAGG